jgi:hypothetical protein
MFMVNFVDVWSKLLLNLGVSFETLGNILEGD